MIWAFELYRSTKDIAPDLRKWPPLFSSFVICLSLRVQHSLLFYVIMRVFAIRFQAFNLENESISEWRTEILVSKDHSKWALMGKYLDLRLGLVRICSSTSLRWDQQIQIKMKNVVSWFLSWVLTLPRQTKWRANACVSKYILSCRGKSNCLQIRMDLPRLDSFSI